MPEPTNCLELQLVQKNSPLECTDHFVAPIENHSEKISRGDSARAPFQVRAFPEKPTQSLVEVICPSSRQQQCSSGDGNAAKILEDLRQSQDLCPGPLGPIPPTKDHSVPNEYWTPLADLTGSRPAVENFSTTRYSPAEWRLHNDRVFGDSHESVQRQRLAAFNAHCCMERVFTQTDKDQQDNNVKLGSRLGLVGRWKFELQRDIAELTSELSTMQIERKRLSRCVHSLSLVESIDKDIKNVRCRRMDHELVRDDVDEELSNELDLCADINNLYTRLVDQVKTQLRELKDAKGRLEVDLTDKKEAWNIDVACRALSNKSLTLQWKAGSVQMPADQSTPGSYEHYCKEGIAMSQTALQRSRILRYNLQDTYENSVRDLRAQADRVDMALARKIDDTVKACRRIENELAQCLKALSDAEDLVDETRAATKKLDGAMKCAQTRLDLRNHRSKVENCRDTPQFGLIDEVKTLSEGVTAMLTQLKRASDTIDDLTKARGVLEKDLVAKRKSLWVDRDRCQLLRSFYPTLQTLAGH